MLFLILLVTLFRAFSKERPEEADWIGLIEFVLLIVVLGAMCMTPVIV